MVQTLFYERQLSDYLDRVITKVETKINTLTKDQLSKECEIVLVENYKIDELKIDETNITQGSCSTTKDISQDMRRLILDRSRPKLVPAIRKLVSIPFFGNAELFSFRPSQYRPQYCQGEIVGSTLQIWYDYISDTPRVTPEVESDIRSKIKFIKEMITFQNTEIDNFNNATLPSKVKALMNKRRMNLGIQDEVTAALGFPLKRKSEPIDIIPLKKKKLELVSYNVVPYPTIDYLEYKYILGILEKTGKALEQSPQTIRELNEEELRFIFLITLNTHYTGQATGETFNKQGKTDIIIKHEGKNLFISECKIWNGEEYILNGLDQLFKNVCWRDSKTSFIIFSRKKNFGRIIDEAKKVVANHPNFIKQEEIISDTCIVYKFKHKDDEEKEIYLALQIFHVPLEEN